MFFKKANLKKHQSYELRFRKNLSWQFKNSEFGRPLIFLMSSFIIFCADQITRKPKSNNIAHYDAFDLGSILLDLYVYHGMLFTRPSQLAIISFARRDKGILSSSTKAIDVYIVTNTKVDLQHHQSNVN